MALGEESEVEDLWNQYNFNLMSSNQDSEEDTPIQVLKN